MNDKQFNSDGEAFECAECGIGTTEDWEIDFHKENFGSDHIFVPTDNPVR